MWIAFILVAPFHLLFSALGRHHWIPPYFLKLVGWLAGLRINVEGRPATGKLLMLSNHLSWLDILALSGASKGSFVAQGGLQDHSFLKWLCHQNGTVFVERERRGSVIHQAEQVRMALNTRRLIIFPEGTTSDGRALLPFKSSLLSAVEGVSDDEVRIQPVVLEYARPADIAWHGSEPGKDNVLRILARTNPVRLTVRFLHPIHDSDRADRKTMAMVAQTVIERSLML